VEILQLAQNAGHREAAGMMLISEDLVAQVRHAWIADQQHPHRGRRKRAIPDSERLGILLDIVFRTSMIPEEGRHVRANVAWLSIADFQDHEMKQARRSELVLRFEQHRPLNSAVLAKLAKTTERGACSLLVDWFDDDPAIWGIIYYRRGQRTLDEIPATIEEGIHSAPDCPILSIDGIGSIVITRGDSVIGRITRGEFSRAVPTPFYSHAMGLILNELFGLRIALKGGRYVDDGDNSYGHGLVECLKYLLEQLDRQAGGALVVFVPQNAMEHALEQADRPWACTGSLELSNVLKARIRHGNTEAEALIRARLDALARLASIDGALLLSSEFELLGFGTKLHAPAWQGTVLEGPDGFGGGGRPFDVSRLGTRHTSAVAYVGAVPGSVAFVASADGPIRGLARKGIGPIHCWPDCRLTMFAS
jgi:hypothetical protein